MRFDRDNAGNFALGLEAAHSRRRILHVRDATGSAIVEALGARILATPSVEVITAAALRLVVGDGGIVGVIVRRGDETILLPTGAVILATGGVGGLWQSTTNPVGARGAGLALAARAGAVLAGSRIHAIPPDRIGRRRRPDAAGQRGRGAAKARYWSMPAASPS